MALGGQLAFYCICPNLDHIRPRGGLHHQPVPPFSAQAWSSGHSTEVLELPIILQGHCESKCAWSGGRVQSMTRKLGSRKLQKGQA